VLHQHLEAPVPRVRPIRPEIPAAYAEVIEQALAKRPEARFATAEAMAFALRAALSPAALAKTVMAPARQAPAEPRVELVAPPAPPARSSLRPLLLGGMALAAVSLFTLLGVWLLSPGRPPRLPPPPPLTEESAPPASAPAPSAPAPAATTALPPPLPSPAGERPAPRSSTGQTLPRVIRPGQGVVIPNPRLRELRPDYDVRRFDVLAYLPRATEHARRALAARGSGRDPVLIGLDVLGVRADGTVDLSAAPAHEVVYRFRSPTASRRAPVRTSLGFERPCLVNVTAQAGTLSIYPIDDRECAQPLLGPPRCSLAAVYAAGKRQRPAGPARSAYGSLVFDRHGWSFKLDGDSSTIGLSDRCAR
jgi:hypothetical protein